MPAARILLRLFVPRGLFSPEALSQGATLHRRVQVGPTRLLLVQLLLAPQEPLVQHLQLAAKADTLRSEPLQLWGLVLGGQGLLLQGEAEAGEG